ncbi:MAG: hypothetical protein IJH34_11455 [Romboutsia sp.]|nr:hypothetical protein [Romboutsia sp.]
MNRNAELNKYNIKFFLITDGPGWASTNVNSKKYNNKIKALLELKIMNYHQVSKEGLLESYFKNIFYC